MDTFLLHLSSSPKYCIKKQIQTSDNQNFLFIYNMITKTTKSVINVYVPNLSIRTDRKASIEKQFKDKNEFELNILPALEHRIGAYGLWQTFMSVVRKEHDKRSEFFIFCEDDHVFTENYNREYLFERIEEADKLNADILSGGVSWMKTPVQCIRHLFWLERFNGMQFTVVYSRFYETLIQADTQEGFTTDIKISELSDNIFVMYPYISVQKEFGYSDVTSSNNKKGYVAGLFQATRNRLHMLDKVKNFYSKHTI